MCASCFRAAQRTSISRAFVPARVPRHASRTYCNAAIIPSQSIYLDFLAPSISRRALGPPKPTNLLSRHLSRRTLATAAEATPTSTPTSPPPSQQQIARAILNPRASEDGTPYTISLSPRAAHRLSKIASADQNPNSALRITIESGGCHGFQYLMNLVDLNKMPAAEDDTVFEGPPGVDGMAPKVVIDESSLELLSGSTVDYTMELIGSQFKVTGIPGATSSCGCGTSFDIKI
ncbi:hypothetical protein BDV96DRAFT_616654 [Lophiotrema nucula]|uniref:Core domain-containing protein n=1 Tax=Lophiotrema nucula TaxID=690887 RepID=A0A6A5YKX2_9PLEO|nr:hypothetical protein BDV96DRAFT_616654 [Lophiotrema nucula]